jgi:pimeloyl-ACP methyl ester carboxylesterase
MHVLEAGFEEPGRPLLLLLHGFPEVAYTWRKVMVPLAEAGFHVVAPDQRGYGRTTGWSTGYDCDLRSFRMLNLVTDMWCLVNALRTGPVAAVVGHDYGSRVAGFCALIRPDVFSPVALMSAPFAGPVPTAATPDTVHHELAQLDPPRKHYHSYYSTREANDDMLNSPQGIHDFMRAYFHYKSADWTGNQPFVLKEWSAAELAKMPNYYIMPLGQSMPESVAPYMPSGEELEKIDWLKDDELSVYSSEFARTGFQGGLNWYRCDTSGINANEMQIFSGLTLNVPSCFIAGANDWGVQQKPGHLMMQEKISKDLREVHLIEGAGHWVQQEQPEAVSNLLIKFLNS